MIQQNTPAIKPLGMITFIAMQWCQNDKSNPIK
jgi:hypothetical protein